MQSDKEATMTAQAMPETEMVGLNVPGPPPVLGGPPPKRCSQRRTEMRTIRAPSSCGGSSEKPGPATAGRIGLLADHDLLAEALSAREVEVLRLVAEGLTDARVAERLYLSPRTVGQHLRSVYNKLGMNSRTAAVKKAVELGLIRAAGAAKRT